MAGCDRRCCSFFLYHIVDVHGCMVGASRYEFAMLAVQRVHGQTRPVLTRVQYRHRDVATFSADIVPEKFQADEGIVKHLFVRCLHRDVLVGTTNTCFDRTKS